MSVFLICAALLAFVSLAIVLAPLLRTAQPDRKAGESSDLSLDILREQLAELEHRAGDVDRSEYEADRAEIERRALEDFGNVSPPAEAVDTPRRGLAATIGLTVCALAIGLYLLIGEPDVLRSGGGPGADGQQAAHAITPQQIQSMVSKLAERLQQSPNDPDGWFMLARSYNALGRYPEAAAAFGRASELMPDNAQLLSDYADTLAMAQGRSLLGAPEALINRALKADPRNVKALALSGSAAFERRKYAAAISEWRKVLAIVPAESGVATSIRNSIVDAESRLSGRAGEPVSVAATTASIRGVVSLDAGLRKTVADSDTVFIFARAVSGPRMPLAILRATVRDLPKRFELNDSMGMPDGPKLSDFSQVVVGARVSRSGNALPQPGDLEGYSQTIPLGAGDVSVAIVGTVP
ncbi:MAG: c-type cytochrome biogenesis protein CcmI [Rhodocyclaceae bacterium]|jgi:cytochrome c-type biogenesis protein CcmH|nr:c-type cytochrome biogenesis protein CcmI [Rhodocyclaceae bacterium]